MFHNHEISWIESRAAGFPSSCLFLTWGMGSAFCVVMVQDISSSREYSWMTRKNEPLKICTSLLCRQDYASLSIFAVLLNKYISELFSLKYNLDVLFLCKRKVLIRCSLQKSYVLGDYKIKKMFSSNVKLHKNILLYSISHAFTLELFLLPLCYL